MLSEIDTPHEKRGILSAADRRFLQNPDDYSRQAANEREDRIVERIRNAMLDFRYLADPEFPEEYLAEAFRQSEGPSIRQPLSVQESGVALSDPRIEDSAVEAITLFHRIYSPSTFNDMIEEAVVTAVDRYYSDIQVVDASYNPDIRDREVVHDRAVEKVEEGLPLTPDETKLLLEYGEVDAKDIAEHVRETGDDTDNE